MLEPNAEKKLEKIGSRLETSPSRSLTEQMGLSSSSVQNKTQVLRFHLHNTNKAHKIYNTYHISFVNWYLDGVHGRQIDFTLILFSDETWFHCSGYENSQNNRYWPAENPVLIQKVPLHDIKFGVWCAMSANKIVEPIFYGDHELTTVCSTYSDPSFLNMCQSAEEHNPSFSTAV
jgi:hypothetical protein